VHSRRHKIRETWYILPCQIYKLSTSTHTQKLEWNSNQVDSTTSGLEMAMGLGEGDIEDVIVNGNVLFHTISVKKRVRFHQYLSRDLLSF